MSVIAVELKLLVRCDQLLQEQPAEQAREHADGEEESGSTRYPARCIERDAAARHDHVDVRMVSERRAPGVQHRRDADASTEVLGIGRDGDHRLGRGLEDNVVDHRLVLVGDVSDCRRQREHHVEVGHRQELGLALGEPLLCGGPLTLRAVPVAAAVVGNGGVAAVLTARAQYRRGPPCGSSRSPTSPSVARGSHGRRWLAAMPVHGRGRYPRPPKPGAARAPRVSWSADFLELERDVLQRLMTSGSSWSRRGCRAPWYRAWRDRAGPGSRGHRCSARADGWQSCAATCAATRAC